MAQAFARFGSSLTLLGKSPRPLPREDADAGTIVQRHLERDGVRCEMEVRVLRVEQGEHGKRLWFSQEGGEARFHEADEILVAAGRAPNVEGLALEAAAVSAGPSGVLVDDRMRTSNPRVYASGDVCSAFKFTHAADALSRIVVQNALFFGRRKASALVIPWATYTDPQVAHVGVSSADADRSNGRLSTITIPLDEVDRAIVDDEVDGFVRVHHERGRLLGCTVVASHAGEMIGEVAYAMTRQGTLGSLSSTVHPYPTVSEAFRKAGDAYRRQALTPRLRTWLERYFRWTR
jgi:pyruvate/2-oxoglutarate dehydrogenase complex dihydrolipoamide dehydrogenase (E3) component